jgi:hypothetical protein
MFFLTWYQSIRASTIKCLSNRKLIHKEKSLARQRSIALQEVKQLERFSYWPTAKINISAKVTDLRDIKRVHKITKKQVPLLNIVTKKQEAQVIPSKIV